MAREQTRTYTCELLRIKATWFKSLFNVTARQSLRLNGTDLSNAHTSFKLQNIGVDKITLEFVIQNRFINIRLEKNTNGVAPRYFFECPYCHRHHTSLYAATNAYACRQCLDLKYLCQSEDTISRRGRRIRKKRFQVWGELAHKFDGNNLLEDSHYWPKPKGRWRKAFEVDRRRVDALENEFYSLMRPFLEGISF